MPTFKVCDSLWPDSEGDAALTALNTALVRLRKILNSDTIISHKNGLLSIDCQQCFVDALAFESILDQADAAIKEKDVPKAMDLASTALRLYRGSFLDGEQMGSWMLATRTRLRSRYVYYVWKVVEYYEKQNNWEAALRVLTKAAKAEPSEEQFSERLKVTSDHVNRYKIVRNVS